MTATASATAVHGDFTVHRGDKGLDFGSKTVTNTVATIVGIVSLSHPRTKNLDLTLKSLYTFNTASKRDEIWRTPLL